MAVFSDPRAAELWEPIGLWKEVRIEVTVQHGGNKMIRKFKQIVTNSLLVIIKRPVSRHRLTKFVIIALVLCLALNFFVIQPGCIQRLVVRQMWKKDPSEPYIDTDYNAVDLKVVHNLLYDYGNASAYRDLSNIEHDVEFEYSKVFTRYLEEKAAAASNMRQPNQMVSPSDALRPQKPLGLKEENITVPNRAGVLKQCPRRPTHIHGRIVPLMESITARQLTAKYIHVLESGGRLRPKNCIARQRLAIIVPYRTRYEHLHILLHNLVPFLMRQQADATFFIIEQALGSTFNRGALLNVGFLEADKRGPFDCYIFHDVDLIPLHDQNLYRCGDNPRHFAVAQNKYDYTLLYPGYFGGVVGFSREQFLEINGDSNLYFGWGGEDDDLLARALNKGYYATRYALGTAEYDMIKHERDKGNEINPKRELALRSSARRQDVEGLSTIKYQVHNVRRKLLYTWITVSLNQTEIFQTAPNYTLSDMAKASAVCHRINICSFHITFYLLIFLVLLDKS